MSDMVSIEALDRIYGGAPVCMALLDPSGEIIWANGFLSEIIASASEARPTVGLSDLFHDDERDEVMAHLTHLLLGQEPGDRVVCEGRVVVADGATLWLSVYASLIRDRLGKPLFAEATLVDFTDKKKADEMISNVAWEWTATFDAMSDALALIDTEYRLTRVNMAMAKMAGMHPRDLVGRKCHEIVHKTKYPWPDCPHHQTMSREESVSAEVDDQNAGCTLHVTCSPLRDRDGKLVGSIHIARDISGQKREAIAKEKLIAELQQAISQVKTLSGLLPICASCKKIRNDEGYWQQLETFISERSEANFTHGICPECTKELYREFYEEKKK